MYVFCVYPAMSKKSENLSDLDKKDRNKRHSSPFINVVKGVFFELCTAEGADKYETGTDVTRTTKKTPLTTFMKGEE
jgi:hypothetical protein